MNNFTSSEYLSQYCYIDVAFGSTSKRNNIIKAAELTGYARRWKEQNKDNGFTDCYKTYFLYPEAMVKHFESNHLSVSQYTGALYAEALPIDIDSKDLNQSLQDTRAVLQHWRDTYRIDLKQVRIYFSGSKGFHLEPPSSLFGFEPSPFLNETFKYIAFRLLPDGIKIDPAVYDNVRLWRLTNTVNSKSGLYKIPLTADEIFSLSIEQIKTLAKTQRKEVISNGVELNTALNTLYLEAKEKAVLQKAQPKSNGSNADEKAYEKFFSRKKIKEHEGRNNTMLSYGSRLRALGMPPDEIAMNLRGINTTHFDPPLDDKEFKDVLYSVARYEKVDNKAEEATDGIICLADYKPKEMTWLIKEAIPNRFPSIIYGDGGLGKSYLGLLFATLAAVGKQSFLGLAFPQEPLNVLYMDYELDADEFHRRALMVAKGLDRESIPRNISYYSPGKSLYKLLPELRRIIEARNIQLLIIDSLAAACVDPDSVRDIVEVFNQIKSLGIAVLILDHQSKMQSQDNYNTKTPYGSVYKFNLSRSVFQLSCIGRENNQISLMLRHKKSNFGRLIDDQTFDISFEGDRVQFFESKSLTPEQQDMTIIHGAMVELKQKGQRVNQNALIVALKGVLSKYRILPLLDRGKGEYWRILPGDRTERLYEPLESQKSGNLRYIARNPRNSGMLNDNSNLEDTNNREFQKSEKSELYTSEFRNPQINGKPKSRVKRVYTHGEDYFYRFSKTIFEDEVSEETVHPGHEDWELCEGLYEFQESRGNGHLKE